MPYRIALGEAGEEALEGNALRFQCGDLFAQGSLLRDIPHTSRNAFGIRKRLANAPKLILAHEDLFKIKRVGKPAAVSQLLDPLLIAVKGVARRFGDGRGAPLDLPQETQTELLFDLVGKCLPRKKCLPIT